MIFQTAIPVSIDKKAKPNDLASEPLFHLTVSGIGDHTVFVREACLFYTSLLSGNGFWED